MLQILANSTNAGDWRDSTRWKSRPCAVHTYRRLLCYTFKNLLWAHWPHYCLAYCACTCNYAPQTGTMRYVTCSPYSVLCISNIKSFPLTLKCRLKMSSAAHQKIRYIVDVHMLMEMNTCATISDIKFLNSVKSAFFSYHGYVW